MEVERTYGLLLGSDSVLGSLCGLDMQRQEEEGGQRWVDRTREVSQAGVGSGGRTDEAASFTLSTADLKRRPLSEAGEVRERASRNMI